jgi:pseudaminic acid cytidylyltransferase
MRIAVIPARGGSKRIHRKNVKEFLGKPVMGWSIKAARESGLFEHIIVSTDDDEIAEVAQRWGAEVPFMRPAALSNDFAGTIEVIAHATEWCKDKGWSMDAVCCIYATAPFVRQQDLQRGLASLESGPWDYAIAATEFAAPIFRSFQQLDNGGLEMFFPHHFMTRSQDLPRALHDAGQFYWGRPAAWLRGAKIFDRNTVPVFIPRWRVQDIDTADDWLRAELLAPVVMNYEEVVDA